MSTGGAFGSASVADSGLTDQTDRRTLSVPPGTPTPQRIAGPPRTGWREPGGGVAVRPWRAASSSFATLPPSRPSRSPGHVDPSGQPIEQGVDLPSMWPISVPEEWHSTQVPPSRSMMCRRAAEDRCRAAESKPPTKAWAILMRRACVTSSGSVLRPWAAQKARDRLGLVLTRQSAVRGRSGSPESGRSSRTGTSCRRPVAVGGDPEPARLPGR